MFINALKEGDLRSKPLAHYPTGRLRTQDTDENNRIILLGQGICEEQHRCKPVAPPLDALKKSMVISTYVLKRK